MSAEFACERQPSAAVARPEIDYERLARALLEHAMDEIKKAKDRGNS